MGQSTSRSRELVLKCALGDEETVRKLLAHYLIQQRRLAAGDSSILSLTPNELIDINFTLPEGDFALEMAVTHQHIMVVRLLIEHGCNIDQQDASGLTALMMACHEPHTEIVKILLMHGHASTRLADATGLTALHYAARFGHIGQIQLLLKHGAPLEARTNMGETPLFLAATNKRYDIARLLLEAGADPYTMNVVGHKPIDFLPNDMRQRYERSVARCDKIIEILYPFLTGVLLETVIDYDESSYINGDNIGLQRIMAYIKHADAVAEALSHQLSEQRREECPSEDGTLTHIDLSQSLTMSPSIEPPSHTSTASPTSLQPSVSPQPIPTPTPPPPQPSSSLTHKYRSGRLKALDVNEARPSTKTSTESSSSSSTAELPDLANAVTHLQSQARRPRFETPPQPASVNSSFDVQEDASLELLPIGFSQGHGLGGRSSQGPSILNSESSDDESSQSDSDDQAESDDESRQREAFVRAEG